MNDAERVILAVSRCPQIGPKRFLQVRTVLQEHAVSWEQMWHASPSQLKEWTLPPKFIEIFDRHRHTFALDAYCDDLARQSIQWITIESPTYPLLLQQIPDPPSVLYYKGDIGPVGKSPIAVVGTRRVTAYGKAVTEKLTRELVLHGCSIISGFMYGVDSVAHRTAIAAGGYTMGVLGYGFSYMYPASHARLASELLEAGGCLCTEHPPHVRPVAGMFPQRNRIVAGLSLGVLVTEAATKSGSKITAQFAGEYGREVFAVPGVITSEFSEGTKELINLGATLVTNVNDIVQQFGQSQTLVAPSPSSSVTECMNPVERQIVQQLLQRAMDVDTLGERVGLPSDLLASTLSEMEILGSVECEGGIYRLRLI